MSGYETIVFGKYQMQLIPHFLRIAAKKMEQVSQVNYCRDADIHDCIDKRLILRIASQQSDPTATRNPLIFV